MKERSTSYYERRFLVSGLPNGSSPSDPHLQIFDNYVSDSELRLRKVRNPSNDARTYSIERIDVSGQQHEKRLLSRIALTQAEYEIFGDLRGRETRKNRYFIKVADRAATYDIFLGRIRGLIILTFGFETESERENFESMFEHVIEITADPFFEGKNLADLAFSDIQSHLVQNKRGAEGAS